MGKKRKIRYNYLFFVLFLYVLIFQKVLQNYIPIFRYFDELLSLLVLVLLPILNKSKNKKVDFKNKYKTIFIIQGLIILIGLISNVIFQYQNIKCIIGDIVIFSKFLLIMCLSSSVFDTNFINKYRNRILKHVDIISLIFVFATVLNYIFQYNPSTIRMGIMSNQIFYDHPTYLVASTVFLIAFRIMLKNKNFDILNVLLIIVLMSTLRFKAIGAAIIALLVSVYVDKTNKKISLVKITIFGLIAVIFTFSHIKYYFLNDGFARNLLTTTSLEVAVDHFPLGTGFATYASHFSVVNYSPVYYKYGLNNVYGLKEGNANFATDVFWPMILGQFGFVGLILYIVIILLVFKRLQNDYSKENKYIYIAKLISLIYLLISSTSESAFVNPIAIPLALIIGFNVKVEEERTQKNEIYQVFNES